FVAPGANLLDPTFQGIYNQKRKHDPDLPGVLSRAFDAGVEKIMVTAGSLEESREALALAASHQRLLSTVGCHPTRCGELILAIGGDDDEGELTVNEEYLSGLKSVLEGGLASGKVVAVGECGLDYSRLQFCGKRRQRAGFEAQFRLSDAAAAAMGAPLPMFLHHRGPDCTDDFVAITKANRARFSGGVVHSFDGTMEEASRLMELDLYIGLNGCSLKTAENLEVVRMLPLDRLMLETDAPWCGIKASSAAASLVATQFPSRKREKFEPGVPVKERCEPCHIIQVLEAVAAIKNMPADDVAAQCLRNTETVFFPQKT
ncbi:unnamed protein product, partial [Phaeothamnion confervicola]